MHEFLAKAVFDRFAKPIDRAASPARSNSRLSHGIFRCL